MQQVNLLVTLRTHNGKIEELKGHLAKLCALSQKENGSMIDEYCKSANIKRVVWNK